MGSGGKRDARTCRASPGHKALCCCHKDRKLCSPFRGATATTRNCGQAAFLGSFTIHLCREAFPASLASVSMPYHTPRRQQAAPETFWGLP